MHYKSFLAFTFSVASLGFSTKHDPDGGYWKDLASIPFAPRQEHTTIAISPTTLAIVGGIIPRAANSTAWDTTTLVQLYDIKRNTWSAGAPLPIMMNHPNAVAVGGKIYVLGGLTPASDGAWRAVPDSWVYDPDKDSWKLLEPMPAGEERGSAVVGVYKSIIFLAGGMRTLMPGAGGEQDTLDLVSAYDSVSRSWLSLPPRARHLPARRDHAGGAVVGSKLYVLGGRDRGQVNVRDTVFTLDLTRLSAGWSMAKGRMPTPRGGIAAAAVGPLVYTFGGEGNPAAGSGGIFNETEVYDTRIGTWRQLGAMKVPRHGTSAVGIGREVYIPGGGLSLGASGVQTFDMFHP
ncbi:hypothetical protein V8C42DRAFT_333536 [Trichoderma barbatum]